MRTAQLLASACYGNWQPTSITLNTLTLTPGPGLMEGSITLGALAGTINGIQAGTIVASADPRFVVGSDGVSLLIASPGVSLAGGTVNFNLISTNPLASNSPRNSSVSVSVTAASSSVLAKTVGAKTAAGVVLFTLAVTAAISGTNAGYFSVDASRNVSVSTAGDAADMGSGTYDLALSGAGSISTLRITVEAGVQDVDTGAKLTAALTAAAASSSTTNWTIALTDVFAETAAVSISTTFAGTFAHPNFGKGAEISIATPSSISPTAVATPTGGSATIKARTPGVPKLLNKVSMPGAGPIYWQGVSFRNVPTTDAYDAKFNDVTQALIWTPTVDGGGAVTGVGSITQTGKGYLASPNERRAYVATKQSGAGSGFNGWFDVNSDGTVDISSPLTITTPGSGYTTASVFSNPTLPQTTQLSTCQSNTASASAAIQVQVSASGTTLPRVVFDNCDFGAGPGANVNRVPFCLDIRNAAQAYVYDCRFDSYYVGVQIWQGDDVEVSRCFSRGNTNDFFRMYPSNTPVGSQATTGARGRLLANVGVQPNSASDWSNSHADWIQCVDPSDKNTVIDFVCRWNRQFWAVNIKNYSTQSALNTQGAYQQKQDISDNLFVISTQNAQLGCGYSTDTAQFARNTGIRYTEEYLSDNAFSPGYAFTVEPWVQTRGQWSSTTTYFYGHVVHDGAGNYYASCLATNLNHAVTDAASWRQVTQYDWNIFNNIVGTISRTVPNANPPTGANTYSLVTADPAGGEYRNGIYGYHGVGNFYLSNYTANTGAGNSMPEIFSGGTAFFDTYGGSNVGWRGYIGKIRTDTYAHALADIDAAFSTNPASLAAGCGYRQAA